MPSIYEVGQKVEFQMMQGNSYWKKKGIIRSVSLDDNSYEIETMGRVRVAADRNQAGYWKPSKMIVHIPEKDIL